MTVSEQTQMTQEVARTGFLDLTDISVHYGAVIALDGISLGVSEGEVVAVMGPNGAGKSTVLKAIMGLAPVVGGSVYWQDRPLAAATHEIVKEGIAFVPQGRRVFTHLTIEENLEMGCLYLDDRYEKERRLDSVMELFPILYEKRGDLASQMSGGQQQMLALGRGLMAAPDVLLLDEPTLGLAPIIVTEVFQKVGRDQRQAQYDYPGRGAQHQGSAGHSGPCLCAGQGPRGTYRHAGVGERYRHTDAGLPRQLQRRRRI